MQELRPGQPAARLIAVFVDWAFALLLLFGPVGFAKVWLDADAYESVRQPLWAWGALTATAYYVLPEAWWEGTLGKHLCGLRLVKADGTSPGLWRSLVRNALRLFEGNPVGLLFGLIFGFLGGIIATVLPRQQRLGDWIAGTYVVAVEPRPPDEVTESGPGAAAAVVLLTYLVLAPAAVWSWLTFGRPMETLLVGPEIFVPLGVAVAFGVWPLIFLYGMGAWSRNGWIPRSSAHQLAVPATVGGIVLAALLGYVRANDLWVAEARAWNPWLQSRGIQMTDDSVIGLLDESKLGRHTVYMAVGWSPVWKGAHAWKPAPADGRGILVDVRTGGLHPETQYLPRSRRARTPEEVDFIGFVHAQRLPKERHGPLDIDRAIVVIADARDGSVLSVALAEAAPREIDRKRDDTTTTLRGMLAGGDVAAAAVMAVEATP